VVLLAGIAYLTWLAVDEDAHNEAYQAKLAFAEKDSHRVVELANREGIPPNGARELLVNDPLSQGPRLFYRHCSACHRYDGRDGKGQRILQSKVDADGNRLLDDHGRSVTEEVSATATELKGFGSREWLYNVLTNYDETFAPMKNAGEKGQSFVDESEMANWCRENKEVLSKPENADSVKELVEFLFAQSGRTDLGKVDEQLVKAGREVFKSGTLKAGSLTSACTDCHSMKLPGESESLGDGAGAGYPTLTGYASQEWLRRFLRDPGHDDFYGSRNLMLQFHEKRLSERELDLLVKWMTGDY